MFAGQVRYMLQQISKRIGNASEIENLSRPYGDFGLPLGSSRAIPTGKETDETNC